MTVRIVVLVQDNTMTAIQGMTDISRALAIPDTADVKVIVGESATTVEVSGEYETPQALLDILQAYGQVDFGGDPDEADRPGE